MDYVQSLAILVSAVLVLRADRQTQTDRSQTAADDRYTHATTVGVSNYTEHLDADRQMSDAQKKKKRINSEFIF